MTKIGNTWLLTAHSMRCIFVRAKLHKSPENTLRKRKHLCQPYTVNNNTRVHTSYCTQSTWRTMTFPRSHTERETIWLFVRVTVLEITNKMDTHNLLTVSQWKTDVKALQKMAEVEWTALLAAWIFPNSMICHAPHHSSSTLFTISECYMNEYFVSYAPFTGPCQNIRWCVKLEVGSVPETCNQRQLMFRPSPTDRGMRYSNVISN